MGYIPNVQFAPFYIAVDKGYFQQEGLRWNSLQLRDGQSHLVGSNLRFAVVSRTGFLARAQGLVVYVLAWWQDYPVEWLRKDQGITTPEDLAGNASQSAQRLAPVISD
jgi:NitT/TauT family transport system substrate-binding protein